MFDVFATQHDLRNEKDKNILKVSAQSAAQSMQAEELNREKWM